jgi:hypothetical protein
MEIYYHPTTPGLGDLIDQLEKVVEMYDYQMGEGPFVIYFPNREIAAKFTNPVAREVVPYLPSLDIVPILIIDTMLIESVKPTLTGGYTRGIHRISKDIAQARATTTTHRMITEELYRTLPERQSPPPTNLLLRVEGDERIDPRLLHLPFGPNNLLAIQGWKGNVSPLLAIICMIELFPPTGYYLFPDAWLTDSDSRYELERLEHIKDFYIPFVGKDHLATLANMWNDMLRNPPDWVKRNSIKPCFLKAHKYYLEAIEYLSSLGYEAREEAIGDLSSVRIALSIYPRLTKIPRGVHPLYTDQEGRLYRINETVLVSGMVATLPDEIIGIILTPPSTVPGEILIGATLEETRIVLEFPDKTEIPDKRWEEIDSD